MDSDEWLVASVRTLFTHHYPLTTTMTVVLCLLIWLTMSVATAFVVSRLLQRRKDDSER